MKRNVYVYVSAAASVVLIAGGPVAAAAAATADTARTAPASAEVALADVDAQGAAEAALKKYPGVVESLDKDGAVWHVDVITKDGKGHAELEVASNGTVTRVDKDTNDDPGEYKTMLAAKITAQQAAKAALAAHPGKAWTVEWDDDSGATYWHVEVKDSAGKTWNAHVDPTTGKVTASGSDSDNDNDNDD